MFYENICERIDLSLLFLIIIILPFSPYFAYFLSLLSLMFFSFKEKKIVVFFLFLLGCWSQLFILNSRAYIVELEYDLSAYYGAYLEISNLSFGDIIEYYSPEIGWYLLYKIIGIFDHNLKVYDIAIINTLICEIGFAIWFYLHGSKEIPKQYLGFVLGLTLLFLWPNNFAFFQRQSISVVFLLFAVSNINKFPKFIFYFLLAGSFHITSLLMGVIYLFIQKNKLKQFVVVSILFIFSIRFLFDFAIVYMSSILGVESIARKANFYVENSIGSFFAISELRFLPLFMFIFILYRYIDSEWKKIALFTALFYISLLGIQFASGRMNFILFYLYGLFLFVFLKKQPRILVLYALSYLVFDLLYKSGIVFSINDNFWQRYEIFDTSPFYYVR